MPFTIAHAVTARPIARLSRGRLLAPALAVGAMAPDFEYLTHLSSTRTIGHTLPGLLVFCLPAGVLVLLLWYRLLGPVLARLLGPGTGRLTAGWAAPEASPFRSPGRFALACLSIVVGAFSHIAWDALTHDGGAVVSLWSGFSHRIGPVPLPVFQWLQYGCSVFGMVLLGVWAHRAARQPDPRGEPHGGSAVAFRGVTPPLSRARRALAAVTCGGFLLFGAVGAVRGADHGNLHDVLKGGVIGALAGALGALALASAVITNRWSRA